MEDNVQNDVNESQAVQAALATETEAQSAVASLATPGNDPLAVESAHTMEDPGHSHTITINASAFDPATQNDPGHAHTINDPAVSHTPDFGIFEQKPSTVSNSGAALAEQREAFKTDVAGQMLTSGVQVQTNHVELVKTLLPSTLGASQAGNPMDSMHGKVNATWPPKAR